MVVVAMSVVSVVTTPIPEDDENAIVEQIRKRAKWDNDGYVFRSLILKGTRDEVSDQHFYCFNVKDDPKTFDEAMSLIIHQMDVKTAFLNGELDEEVYMNQPQGFIMPGNKNKVFHEGHGEVDVILGIRIKHKSNGIAISQSHYIEKVLKKFNYFNCTPVSTPMDTSKKLMANNGQVVSQLEYSRVIGCLMYAMTCTRPNISFVVVLEGYTYASWIRNSNDNSSTSGWVFLLGGGAISWAYKKQTCITGSTMEFKFVAVATVGKEAECSATLAKAYSQMYNGKSRNLGVRHNMISELIMNGVISIEFVRLQLESDNLLEVNAKTCLEELRTQFKEFLASKGNMDTLDAVIHRAVNTYGILRMKENDVNALRDNGRQLDDELLREHQIKKSFKLQSQDVQINP
ncbi:zinc finger, CCHC-type containing protein [Tanacetum coccineum]